MTIMLDIQLLDLMQLQMKLSFKKQIAMVQKL